MVNAGQVSGFVWLDNNANGLQDAAEPGFAQNIPGLGFVNVALYPDGSADFIATVVLNESSGGHYRFDNVPTGNYYLCTSREYDVVGLAVTTQDAGNDAIDNDFDGSPCAYDISITNTIQTADVDLGFVGGTPTPPQPNQNGNLNDIIVKTDRLSINHQWRHASNTLDIADSVVFHSAPTSYDTQRGVVRMRRSSSGTEFKFQNWGKLNSRHNDETINIVSIQQGYWDVDNTQIEVGHTEINGTGKWKTIHFSQTYSTPPAVILSLQTTNGVDAVDVHARRITTDSMQIALFEEERKMRFEHHAFETVGYLLVASASTSIDLGNGDETRIALPFQTTGIEVNHTWQIIGRDDQIGLEENQETNLANKRLHMVKLEEDQTRDQETDHTFEHVHVVKIDDTFLTQIASAAGGDTSVLRSRTEDIPNPTDPNPGNQVDGFIWLDENEDGLQTPGEPGIADVRVSYFKAGKQFDVKTDDAGYYEIRDIGSGTQLICVFQRYPNLLTLTTMDAGDDALDSDFDNEHFCTTVQLKANQHIDVDMGVIGYDDDNRPGGVVNAPSGSESLLFYTGYIWEDKGPILHILDGEDKGLAGIEIIVVERSNHKYINNIPDFDETIIASTFTDTNGYFEFAEIKHNHNHRLYVKSIPDLHRTIRNTSQGHSVNLHGIRLGSVYHNLHYDDDSQFGVLVGDPSGRTRFNFGLALLKKHQPEPQAAVIQLRGGFDRIADGVLGVDSIEWNYLRPTIGGFSRRYTVYDDQMRAIMSNRHAGSAFSTPVLEFFPLDATRDYILCSPGDDISRYLPIPLTDFFGSFGIGILNDFSPETGCTQPLNFQKLLSEGVTSTIVQIYLLVKLELPEKLFGSVWLHEGGRRLERAPAVEFTLFQANSGKAVATARSGVEKPDHGLSDEYSDPDDSDLVYFPDDLAPGDYYLCADTQFEQDGLKISPLSTFDTETGCTDVFHFPEQRQSHTPSLILEPQ